MKRKIIQPTIEDIQFNFEDERNEVEQWLESVGFIRTETPFKVEVSEMIVPMSYEDHFELTVMCGNARIVIFWIPISKDDGVHLLLHYMMMCKKGVQIVSILAKFNYRKCISDIVFGKTHSEDCDQECFIPI